MALAAATVWEVRTAGLDTNGGGFVTGAAGTDYSQQDAKNTVGNNISTADAVAVGTGVITSATATFTSAIVGNIIYLQGGTGALAAGWYQVTVFTSATSITVDRNVAAGTGITMNIGGALLSPAIPAGLLVAGHTVYVKAGTYSITSAATNIAGGCVSTAVRSVWEGYQTTRGDLGTAPVLQASGISTFTIMSLGANDSTQRNFTFDGASLTSSRGFTNAAARVFLYKCLAKNCTNNGFAVTTTQAAHLSFCAATGCSTTAGAFSGAGMFHRCEAYANSVSGFAPVGNGGVYLQCLAYGNTGATSDGFSMQTLSTAVNCTAYGNGRAGFLMTSTTTVTMINCLAEANTTFGYSGASGVNLSLVHCGAFNNTSGATTGTFVTNIGFVTGTGSFFTNAAGGDFSLNTTAGGGAAARATGVPGVFFAGTTTGYLDLGAAQHADPVGGGDTGSSNTRFNAGFN